MGTGSALRSKPWNMKCSQVITCDALRVGPCVFPCALLYWILGEELEHDLTTSRLLYTKGVEAWCGVVVRSFGETLEACFKLE